MGSERQVKEVAEFV
jgi:hypothetical protein